MSRSKCPTRNATWIPVLESEISGWNPELAGRDPVGGYKCSRCGRYAIRDCNDKYVLSDFCPFCGAEMTRFDNGVRVIGVDYAKTD